MVVLRPKLTQSQSFGFVVERECREKVFKIEGKDNDTSIHDIPKSRNKFNQNENVSIKTCKDKTIYCADVRRFYKYNFKETNTICVICYTQGKKYKRVKEIYEIDYNEKCHKMLFGDLPYEILQQYVRNVKKIPTKVKGEDANKIFNYLEEKKKLKQQYNFNIDINPKVDSSQTRVQCSIPNFRVLLKDFITYKSASNKPNVIRGIEIAKRYKSLRRKRGGLTVKKLKDMCRKYKIKGYSKLRKSELVDLLKSKKIL